MDAALKLAEELGGETKVLVGGDIPGELLRFAKFENVTQIVVGRSQGSDAGRPVPADPCPTSWCAAPRKSPSTS